METFFNEQTNPISPTTPTIQVQPTSDLDLEGIGSGFKALVSKFGYGSLEKFRASKEFNALFSPKVISIPDSATEGSDIAEHDSSNNHGLGVPPTTSATERLTPAGINAPIQKDNHGGAIGSGSESRTRSYAEAFMGVQSSPLSMEREKLNPWSSLIKDTVFNLNFIPPTMVEGKPEVHISSAKLQGVKDLNAKLVVGNFVGRKSSFSFVRTSAEQFWETKDFTMKTQGEMFTFEFKDAEIRAKVLDKGSFFIASCVFYIRPWRLFVEQDIKELATVPIWVLFERFPMELWDKEGFSRVGSAIGTPLFLDSHTAQRKSTNYARICIEIDAAKELPEDITVVVDQRKAFKLVPKYKWKPARCSKCRVFGHGDSYCPSSQSKGSKAWVKSGAVASKPIVIAADVRPHVGGPATATDPKIAPAKTQGSLPEAPPTVKNRGSGHNNTAIPNGAWQIPGKKHTTKRVCQPKQKSGEVALTSSADPISATAPTTSTVTACTPAPTSSAAAPHLLPMPTGQETTPLTADLSRQHPEPVVRKQLQPPQVTPFKGLIPRKSQTNPPGKTKAGNHSNLDELPMSNPFEVKEGERMSFEEELKRHSLAAQWEEERKKAAEKKQPVTQQGPLKGTSPVVSPRRSIRRGDSLEK